MHGDVAVLAPMAAVVRGVVSPKLGKSFSACSLASGLNFGSTKVSIVRILNQYEVTKEN